MKSPRSRRAFTLIEMLVVIVIPGILAGIVFKMYSMVNRRGEVGESLRDMEAMASALSEFYAEYGQYPPAAGMGYEYENTTKQHPVFCNIFLPQNPGWRGNTLFSYSGLISWLWPRTPQGGSNWPLMPGSSIQHSENVQWIGDTDRDFTSKVRWARFLSEIELTQGDHAITTNAVESGGDIVNWPYTNDTLTVLDPWDNAYQYETMEPYMSYKLWSYGPDEAPNTDDDIFREGWD